MKKHHPYNLMAKWPDGCDPTKNGSDRTTTCLRYALLCESDLKGADLRGADLTGASLRDARIDHRTDFRGAKLCGADLRAHGLSEAVFSAETVYDEETRFPNGFRPEEHDLTRFS